MGEVGDAIILAGGMGTRMLPASLYVPKETLPLVDTPLINHLIWEAAKAGVRRVHLVLSERKREILGDFLEGGTIHGEEIRIDLPRDALSLGTNEIEIVPHIQTNPGGVGDAISVALEHISGPFLVLLGDMILAERHCSPNFSGVGFASSASLKLVSKFEKSGLPCVGIYPVGPDLLSNYGVVELLGDMVVEIVEKPEISQAPSEYVLCGRYLLPDSTLGILNSMPISEFGEMQSIYLLNHLIDSVGLQAVNLENMDMYDSGDPISWLKAQIDHSLKRKDISKEISDWIRDRM